MFDWLFGTKRQTNYDDTNSMYNQYNEANSAADDYYNKNIANVDWDSLGRNDRLDRIQQFGNLDAQRQGLGQQYGKTYDMYNQENEDRKHDYFGNGVLGMLLNPIGQTATAGMDLLTGEYEANNRDVMSDIGAAGQTALSLIPGLGGLARSGGIAGKIGAGINRTVNSIPGMAATGAGLSGLETLRQDGSNTDMGDVLSSMGSGAAFGAGIGAAGRVGGRILRNQGAKSVANKYISDPKFSQLKDIMTENPESYRNMIQSISQIKGRDPSTLTGMYGGLYQNALQSMIPKSTVGRLAAGGAGIYGASRLMGGQEQPAMSAQYNTQAIGTNDMDIINQVNEAFANQYGRLPSEYELAQIMQGGY